jgi:ABC-type phosphate/phosphonate transport system substrate-binding protein
MVDERTEPAGTLLTRRRFVAAAAGVAAGAGIARLALQSPGELTVGLCDPLARVTASACVGQYATREYEGLVESVRAATGIRIRLQPYALDDLLIAAVRRGEVDAVICKAWTALRAGAGLERLADLPGTTGARLLRGIFIARRDSAARTIEDIAGRRFALTAGAAYESSHQARHALTDAGIAPGEVVTEAACLNVAAMVWERQADAGVVSDYCVDHSGLQLTGDPEAFRVIGRTDGVPFVTFAVGQGVSTGTGELLREHLLSLAPGRVPEGLATTGLIAPITWQPEELRTA